jgi:CheY-like chemotaxis protein
MERLAELGDEEIVEILALGGQQRRVDGAAVAGAGYVVRDQPLQKGGAVLAGDGEEGLRMAASERPQLIILDLTMPGVDGFAVVERLQADPTTADIPIIVLTARTMTAEDKARLNGRISYLAQKGSFDRASFVALVQRHAVAPTT